MVIVEGTCEQINNISATFSFFSRELEYIRRISIPLSKCTSDSPPICGDRVLLLSENSGFGDWECADILEHRPPDEGIIVEIGEDIWNLHTEGYWVCVTTNGEVKSNRQAVMGKGIAKEAADRFPSLPSELGKLLRNGLNVPHIFKDYRLITFPTKRYWRNRSIPSLIRQSYRVIVSDEFKSIWSKCSKGGLLCMPRPGCGHGGLEWDDVRRVLLPHWNMNTIVVSR